MVFVLKIDSFQRQVFALHLQLMGIYSQFLKASFYCFFLQRFTIFNSLVDDREYILTISIKSSSHSSLEFREQHFFLSRKAFILNLGKHIVQLFER